MRGHHHLIINIRKVMPSALYQLTKKPLVGWITVQGIIKPNTYFSGVDCSLQVAIYVAALVSFGHEVVEIPHGDFSLVIRT